MQSCRGFTALRCGAAKGSSVGAERRVAERKAVDQLVATDITSLSHYKVIAKIGCIVDASTKGFLLSIQREDLVPTELRQNLSLEGLVGQQVVLFLPQMNLDLDGSITRAKHKGKGQYEIAVNFSADVPEYWRECLVDLLPSPGEMEK
jgi:hypothetical protein